MSNLAQFVDSAGSTTEELASKNSEILFSAVAKLGELRASLMRRDEAHPMLMALVDAAKRCQLDDERKVYLNNLLIAGDWTDGEREAFLAACELQPQPPKFTPLSFTDLLDRPPKEWLIDQVLGKGDLGMIYGPPGCGKTFVVIDLIFAACLQRQFAMRFDIARPLNVAYCAGEGISGLPSRFRAAAEFYGDTLTNFTFFEQMPQLYVGDDSLGESITQFVREWRRRQADEQAEPLDLLVIDTLHSATAGADENSARDMGVALTLAKAAVTELGCAVLLVHHTNKNGTAERGSSALRGAMDCMIEISPVGESGTKAVMRCAKLKDGEAWKDQTFDLVASGESVRVWWDKPASSTEGDKRKSETGREILGMLATNTGEPLTSKQVSDALGLTQQNVNIVLARLVKDKLAERGKNKRETWCFTITDQGREALSQAYKSI